MNKLLSLPAALLIASSGLLLASCGENKAQTKITEDAVIVRTQQVTFTDYAAKLEYSGSLASTRETKLSFKIGGIISKIYVKEGDHVSRGQLLATLDLTE